MSPENSNSAFDESCLFCKIVKKEIPAKIIEEGDDFLAFHDINPQAPMHALVIPKTHIPDLVGAEDCQMLGELFKRASRIAKREGLDNGFRVVVNTGDDGGQTVHHLHVHVLGGRKLSWPPG